MTKKVHIIINPASGQPQPILNQINDVFYPAGVEWDVSLTQKKRRRDTLRPAGHC